MKAILMAAALAGAVLGLSLVAPNDAHAHEKTSMMGNGSMMEMMMGSGPGGGMRMMGQRPMMSGTMGTGACDALRMGGDMRQEFDKILGLPDLTKEQSSKLRARSRALQRELWRLGGEAMDARFKVEDLTRQDLPAPKAVGKAVAELFDVQRRMVEARVAALNDAQEMLTDEQRQALKGIGSGKAMRNRMGMVESGMR